VRDSKRTRAISPPPRTRSYTAVKAEWEAVVAAWAREFVAARGPVGVPCAFEWREVNRHRDPDGVAAGGRKLLLDGLVKAGVLAADRFVTLCAGWRDVFVCDALPGVMVSFGPGLSTPRREFFPYRLPDLNELLALRELSARRSVKSSLRGRLA
jgi:hypothetical protein